MTEIHAKNLVRLKHSYRKLTLPFLGYLNTFLGQWWKKIIKDKDHLSSGKAEISAELGNKAIMRKKSQHRIKSKHLKNVGPQIAYACTFRQL